MIELDNWEQNEDNNVDQYVSTSEAALNVLRVDCKLLCPSIERSSNIQAKLVDTEKDIEKPTLAFERNELLADFVQIIFYFWSFEIIEFILRARN